MKRLTQVYGIEILKQLILDEDASELKKIGDRSPRGRLTF